jgi:hypothetical protein
MQGKGYFGCVTGVTYSHDAPLIKFRGRLVSQVRIEKLLYSLGGDGILGLAVGVLKTGVMG